MGDMEFNGSFHFLDTEEEVLITLSMQKKEKVELKNLSYADKRSFLLSYINSVQNGDCPLVLNSKIPEKIRANLFDKVSESEFIKAGHILCSSGTTSKTGTPKHFYFPIERAVANARAHCKSLDLDKGLNILFPLPLTHSFGVVIGIWGSLVTNSRTFISPENFVINDIFNTISDKKIDLLYLTPGLVRQINKFGKRYKGKIVSPKKISIGSSALFYEDVNQLKSIFKDSEVYYTYGLTEMGPRVSTFHLDTIEKGAIPIGQPLEGVLIKGDKELEVLSPYCALEFDNKFIKTHDEIENTSLGPIIKGRLDDTIIYQGINIYPAEIEAHLLELEGVEEAVIIGLDSKLHGKVPVLVIQGSCAEEIIFERLKEVIPESHNPKKVYFLEKIPKTSLGKIQRNILKTMLS